jgi:hypothetical protein
LDRGVAGPVRAGPGICLSIAPYLSRQLTEGERGLLANIRAGIFQCSRERIDGSRVTNLSECKRHLLAHVGIRVLDGDDQCFTAARSRI